MADVSVEPDGQHEYRVRVAAEDSPEPVESRFTADAAVLEQLGATPQQEQQVIEATAAFLIDRQPAGTLPATVDLDQVAAAYDDYYDTVRARLHTPTGTPDRARDDSEQDLPPDVGRIADRLEKLVTELRRDVGTVDDPRGQALLETAAEVLSGLSTAFTHFQHRSEQAWQPND